LFVPVRYTESGALVLRLGRLGGESLRVGIAFSSERRLVQASSPGQQWVRLTAPALRAMLRPLGVDRIQLDPGLVVPALPDAPAPEGSLVHGHVSLRPARQE